MKAGFIIDCSVTMTWCFFSESGVVDKAVQMVAKTLVVDILDSRI